MLEYISVTSVQFLPPLPFLSVTRPKGGLSACLVSISLSCLSSPLPVKISYLTLLFFFLQQLQNFTFT